MSDLTLLFIGGLGAWELMTIMLFMLLPLVLWIWALTDLLRSEFQDNINKLIWALVIVMLPLVGALLYLFIGRQQKVKVR
jgi:hypothetical protein